MPITEPFTVLEQAIDSVTRLRATLARGRSMQVQNGEERNLIKATAQAWFRSHRPMLGVIASNPGLERADHAFAALMECADRNTTRKRYLAQLKEMRAGLVSLRSSAMLRPAADAPEKPDFGALVTDRAMEHILDRRWAETVACVGADAPMAATVMMGGLLEALFLAKINLLKDQAPVFKAAAAPRDKNGQTRRLKEWGLKDYLDVAHELGWIRQAAKDVGEVLRDYRNYIHPEKEKSHGVMLHRDDAMTFLTVFCAVADQILQSKDTQ